MPTSYAARVDEQWLRLRRIHDADVGRSYEFLLRNAIIVSVSLTLVLVTGLTIVLWWLLVFETINVGYFTYMKRQRPPGSRQKYRVAVGFYVVTTSFFALMPLYLWTLPDPAVNAVAVAALFGLAMLNLTRHTFDPNIARADMAVVGLSILFMGFYWIAGLGMTGESLLIGLGAFCSAGYYVYAHIDGLKLRTRVMENERRAGQSAKIQAIGQLTTGIAHDFNNILTVVLGNIELARLAPHAAEADESLTEAHRAAERAAGLVAQLLAFSRRAQLNPVPVDAGNMLETFGRTMQRILPATITLRHELAPGLPPILCDRPSLDTALMNLVINARDAIEGRGTITVAITRAEILSDTDDELRPGTYARIAVRDTGPGIPDHLIDRVAEPFFTTKSIGQGSGLGLPMVKGFSEQSGGGLEIANTAAGAEIAMYLPLVTTAAPDSQRR